MNTDTPRLMILPIAIVLAAALAWLFASRPGQAGPPPQPRPDVTLDASGPWEAFARPADSELKRTLTDMQYKVTQREGTEPPFRNAFWNLHEDGIFVDVVSGEPLFCSLDKFNSGTGWPSFTRPLIGEYVVEHVDNSLGMRRVEVRSKIADSHLGHVFPDGPAPTGLRYCINSAALRFIAVADLQGEGYGEFVKLFRTEDSTGEEASMTSGNTETATLAGGCFWGMEDILRSVPGVTDTEVGYTGGHVENATYMDVRTGTSGHAESIQITFDPERVSYEEILHVFFRMHDPTTLNRQGNDRGSQYRSAIFYHDEAQRAVAERVKAEVDASDKWKDPVVTEIVPAGPFYSAEDYHQDYLVKNPGGYTCHFLRD